jgi:hypothetical protein
MKSNGGHPNGNIGERERTRRFKSPIVGKGREVQLEKFGVEEYALAARQPLHVIGNIHFLGALGTVTSKASLHSQRLYGSWRGLCLRLRRIKAVAFLYQMKKCVSL